MVQEIAGQPAPTADRDAQRASLARIAAELESTRQPFDEARTLPGAVYTSAEIFAREQRALFGRSWLAVGRTLDIPAAGDWFLKDIAQDSIIVVRGADGEVRAFYNVCRHRGSRLLDATSGRGLSNVLCPYHSWSYNLDGSLRAAPQMGPNFRRAESGLVPVRLGIFHGFIFVNLDDSAEPLERHFSDLPDLHDYHMENLHCGKRIEYDIHANWKLIAENYSECYHCAANHPQLVRISEHIASGERIEEIGRCYNGGPMRMRDGVETMSMSGKSTLPMIPGLTHDDQRYVHYYVVYPNMLLSPHPDYVLVHTAWPSAPDRTHVICEWLFTEEAVKSKGFDPRDVVEFWDVTNRQDWSLCERAQAGIRSRGFRQGPYQPTEDCVYRFDRWYADQLAGVLASPAA